MRLSEVEFKVMNRPLRQFLQRTVEPVVGGIILLVQNFTWLRLGLLLLLAVLALSGNAIVRGSFACKYCKQRELGCPAERLFDTRK